MGNREGFRTKKKAYIWKNGEWVKNIDAIDILLGVWCISLLLFMLIAGIMVIGFWERYIEIYLGVYVIVVVVIEFNFYAIILLMLKKSGEEVESTKKILFRSIGVSIVAIAIGIFTPLCRYAPDLDNWILNNTEELTDVAKDFQVEEIQRGAGVPRGYDYRVIVITENNGSFKFVNETDEEREVLKGLKVGDKVTIHYLPKSKIPTGIVLNLY